GVTLPSIGVGALGEPALAHLLEDARGGTFSHGVAVAIAVIVSFSVISFAQLIGGETVPKFYAIERAEAVARRVARPLRAFKTLFHPVIVLVTLISDRLLRMLGVESDAAGDGGSQDELKRLIAESQRGGAIDA